MDDIASLDALMQRLKGLERNIYWLKLTVVVIAGMSLLLGAASSRVPEEIRAKRFLVIDPAGNAVGEFSAKEGQPALTLSDPRGGPRVALWHGYDTGSGLSLSNGKRPLANLNLGYDSSVALDLFDREGKLRAVISVTEVEGPQLFLHDRNGKVLRKLP